MVAISELLEEALTSLSFGDHLLTQPCLLAAGSGVLSHLIYFIHGIKDNKGLEIALTLLTLQCFLLITIFAYTQSVASAVRLTGSLDFAYLTGLYTSMTIYRVFFHRLRGFPGPLMAKISKTGYGFYMARNSQYHLELLKLHRKYGDIVRIGPNELSITDVGILHETHSPLSKCEKGTLYWIIKNSVATIEDRHAHKIRRRAWDQAFTGKALAGYEVKTRVTLQDWFEVLDKKCKEPIDISLYSILIVFDNVGRIGYSREWGVVKAGKEDRMLELLGASFKPMGKMGRVAWPLAIGARLNVSKDLVEFDHLANTVMDERESRGGTGDIAEHILKAHAGEIGDHNETIPHLESQALLMAATDSVANALAWAFYYLGKDERLRNELRKALTPVYHQGDREVSHSSLAQVKYLNAVINETLRMNNSVTTGGPRITPKEGLRVGDIYIPGTVNFITPHHIIHRSASNFVQPDDFIPERWLTRDDLILNEKAFAPFLLGPFGCVGKQLALMELRMILAETVWNYDFEFAPGEDGSTIQNKSIDMIILRAAPLFLKFTKRRFTENT